MGFLQRTCRKKGCGDGYGDDGDHAATQARRLGAKEGLYGVYRRTQEEIARYRDRAGYATRRL